MIFHRSQKQTRAKSERSTCGCMIFRLFSIMSEEITEPLASSPLNTTTSTVGSFVRKPDLDDLQINLNKSDNSFAVNHH